MLILAFLNVAGEFYHEIAAQILLMSLRQARRNESFSLLSRQDQDAILRHVWNELFLLHASYWPIDVSALIRRALASSKSSNNLHTVSTSLLLRRSLELCQNLQLDAVELSLLETLILCRKGKVSLCSGLRFDNISLLCTISSNGLKTLVSYPVLSIVPSFSLPDVLCDLLTSNDRTALSSDGFLVEVFRGVPQP